MHDHIERTWGWDERWQRAEFRRRFRKQRISVIEIDAKSIGAIWLEDRRGSVYIEELQILPEYQGRGVGTAVLKQVIAAAGKRGLAVGLAVLRTNPGARRLYERLGFKVTAVAQPFVYMRHTAPVVSRTRKLKAES